MGGTDLLLVGASQKLDGLEVEGSLPFLPILLPPLTQTSLADAETAAEKDEAGRDGDHHRRPHWHCKRKTL